MCKKSTKEEFIQKAIKIHDNTYDYSLVEYINNKSKVIIICDKGHEFLQKPNDHLSGYGCYECNFKHRLTNDVFIEKAKLVHGDKFNYSEINYINSKAKLKIICKEHGEFLQKPQDHLNGNGCPKCASNFKLTTESFIERSKKIHKNKYDYSLSNYTGLGNKIKIICKQHGVFDQTPSSHINQKSGCLKCSGKQQKTTEDFIKEVNIVHNNKYLYNKCVYKNVGTKVIITCKDHGDFKQNAGSHLSGNGCPSCYGNVRKTTDDFIKEANEIHNNKYNYDNTQYINLYSKIKINCLIHGEFAQTPKAHLRGSGCVKCSGKISKIETLWLDSIEKENNTKILRQYYIKELKIKADGYDPITNTVYEFHGDFYHGNPNKFNSNDFNKKLKCKFGDLYNKTLEKENKIKEAGYNLVVIWESDFNIKL